MLVLRILIPSENDTEPQFDDLVDLTTEANELAILICRQKEGSFDNSLLKNLRDTISNLILVEQIQNEMIESIEQFAKEFGQEDSEAFLSGVIQALEKSEDMKISLVELKQIDL